MIKFVLVDNNLNDRNKVKKIIISKMMSNKIFFNIYEYENFNKELKDYINKDSGNSIFFISYNRNSLDIINYIRNEKNDWLTPFIILDRNDKRSLELFKSKLYILDLIVKSNNMDESIYENIDICLRMLSYDKVYKYTYKNVHYIISLSSIDYIQREGRRIKIVTNNEIYYQNIPLTEIRKYLPKNFISSTRGVIINKNNIKKIDWNKLRVYFKDGENTHIISVSHRKELETLK